MIDCNEWRTEKRHECANMGKVKRLELWWQQYRTSLPVWDLENFRTMDFCWHECTSFKTNVLPIVLGVHLHTAKCRTWNYRPLVAGIHLWFQIWLQQARLYSKFSWKLDDYGGCDVVFVRCEPKWLFLMTLGFVTAFVVPRLCISVCWVQSDTMPTVSYYCHQRGEICKGRLRV